MFVCVLVGCVQVEFYVVVCCDIVDMQMCVFEVGIVEEILVFGVQDFDVLFVSGECG